MSESTHELITLINDDKTEIKYVYHISDTHIRNVKRHSEYKNVFEKTYQKIISDSKNKKNRSLIVLTGDIMHSKTELSPDAMDLAYSFFYNLSQILPVIIIMGNHDCNMSNKNRLDALTPIINNTNNLQNCYYLKQTGMYQYNNIIFGLSDIFADVPFLSENIDTKMWNSVKQTNKYKIALYHGIVRGSKTDMGYEMKSEKFRAKDFRGYHYTFLGDIHKHQYLNDNKTIAYAGSLIQQSHGETLHNHGILKWNLLTGKSIMLEIPNDCGFCTINVTNGKMLDEIIPINPNIKFILQQTSQEQFQQIEKQIRQKYKKYSIIKENKLESILNAGTLDKKNKLSLNTNHDDFIVSYLNDKIPNKKDRNDIYKLHTKIYNKMINVDDNKTSTSNQCWKIIEIQFSNMFCYGENNVINFNGYDHNQIIGIVAPNRHGKSAILDIILYCLFEKCSRGKALTVLNKNKNFMKCSILFEINSKKYLIERTATRGKNDKRLKLTLNFTKISLSPSGQVKSVSLNDIDKNITNKNIVNMIGSYDDYLTTCIYVQQQGKHGNFIDMTELQKKNYLSEILKLNVFDRCETYAKDKTKLYTAQLKILKEEVNLDSIDSTKQNIDKLKKILSNLHSKKTYINDKLLDMLNMSEEFIKMPELTKYHDLLQYNLDSESEIVGTTNNLINKINNCKPNKIISKIKKHERAIVNLKHTNTHDASTSKFNIKLEKLYVRLINIPDHINNINIDQLEISRTEIETKIMDIENSLTLLDNESKEKSKAEIKKEISDLQKTIKYVDPTSENKLQLLIQKLKEIKLQLSEASVNYFDDTVVTKKQQKDLVKQLKLQNNFAEHVKATLNYLYLYSDNIDLKNVVDLQNQWLADHNNWKNKTTKLIKTEISDIPSVNILIEKTKKLNQNIFNVSNDVLTLHDNNNINIQISKLKYEIDILDQIDDHNNNKEMLLDKLQSVDDNIKNYTFYKNHVTSNIKINKQIIKIKNNIRQFELDKADTKSNIKRSKLKIINYNKQLLNIETYKSHLRLLKIFKLEFLCYTIQKQKYNRMVNQKNELIIMLNNVNNNIKETEFKLTTENNIIKQLKKSKRRQDNLIAKHKLYTLYNEIMGCNGIPYEILKSVLPEIESKVNQTLHNMTNFSIEFTYNNNGKKTMKKGAVGMNICYLNQIPYEAEITSGFEKFIIGVAIRMVLCDISKTAKPNFFIIDEGWVSLDTENLSNLDNIMMFIKNQFDHVIIISHINELKSQADYIININKKRGLSHVNNSNIITL